MNRTEAEERALLAEFARVEQMLGKYVASIEENGGNIRFFAAAYLASAVKVYAEVEGTASLHRTITRLGTEAIVGRCGGSA